MISFKPKNLTEDEFEKLIEENSIKNKELQLLLGIKEVISSKYYLYSSLSSGSVFLSGFLLGFGYMNSNIIEIGFSAVFAFTYYFLTNYSNTLLTDYEYAIQLIQDDLNEVAYAVGQAQAK